MKNRANLRGGAILLLLSTLVLLPASCGTKKPDLVLLCGSSFVAPVREICKAFEKETGVHVETTIAGSEDFLPQVKTKSVGDLLVTHDPYMDYTKQAGALADSVQVGFVAPVLVVAKGNPKGLKSIEDLAQPGVKVALSDPRYSTCGEMVARFLKKKGIYKAVMKNVGNRLTKGHSRLGTLLVTGVVDAVIMWNGVAWLFRKKAEIVPTPYEYDNEIRVHVIGLSYSKRPDLVKKFMEIARKIGPKAFASHGYVK